MWGMKEVIVIPVIVGALGAISTGFEMIIIIIIIIIALAIIIIINLFQFGLKIAQREKAPWLINTNAKKRKNKSQKRSNKVAKNK